MHLRRGGDRVVAEAPRQRALPTRRERPRPAEDWWLREPVSVGAPPMDAPFFADAVGLPMRTASVRALVQRIAVMAGLDPAEFGAKSLRVGGATDWRDCLGDASARVVKQRGRWCSDTAEVYQRPLLASVRLSCGHE